MSTQNRANPTPVQIHADHASQKRLGNWTTARAFQVRARHAHDTIDLRSPQIPDSDIELDLDLDRSAVKLLVAADAVIDHWGLAGTGTGKVKQTCHHNPAGTSRRIRLTGRSVTARSECKAAGSPVCRRSPRETTSPTPAAPTPAAAHPPWTTPPAAPDTEENQMAGTHTASLIQRTSETAADWIGHGPAPTAHPAPEGE